MSGDELTRPRNGSVRGVPFVALPPTAVDAPACEGLVVSWHAFDAPRTEAALAAAVPMTGVPVWRVYLGLRLPDIGGQDYLDLLGAKVESAVAELPAVVAELRELLGCGDGAIGLAGHGEGGTAALLAVAEQAVPVSALALVSPIADPARTVAARERRFGPYPWTEASRTVAERLDLVSRAGDIARCDPRTLLVAGATDLLVPAAEVLALRDALTGAGVTITEASTFRMGHALAAEPGMEPRPPIAAAVSVDAALTDWFRRHLTTHPPKATRPLAVHLS
ncbi:alpha/beta hydrolase family protein [Actinocorallia longicatena]